MSERAGPIAGEKVLQVREVGVRLSGRQILDNVSFTLRSGEFTGLIGSNGAGKTTLFRVILGLQRPSEGAVQLPTSAGRTAHRVGYVPQRAILDPDLPLRARDLVALGFDGSRLGVPLRRAKRRELAAEMLEAVDAVHFADSRVGRLSGGELQRVLIAHALVSSPDLVLLDEPLANLDISSSQEIIELLHRIVTDRGVAVFLSAHEMNPLLPVMDRLVYLAGGRAASGSAEEVVRPEVLSSLYGHHVDVIRVHGRILVVAGHGSADEEQLAQSPTLVRD